MEDPRDKKWTVVLNSSGLAFRIGHVLEELERLHKVLGELHAGFEHLKATEHMEAIRQAGRYNMDLHKFLVKCLFDARESMANNLREICSCPDCMRFIEDLRERNQQMLTESSPECPEDQHRPGSSDLPLRSDLEEGECSGVDEIARRLLGQVFGFGGEEDGPADDKR